MENQCLHRLRCVSYKRSFKTIPLFCNDSLHAYCWQLHRRLVSINLHLSVCYVTSYKYFILWICYILHLTDHILTDIWFFVGNKREILTLAKLILKLSVTSTVNLNVYTVHPSIRTVTIGDAWYMLHFVHLQ